jgi:hypothetical protein
MPILRRLAIEIAFFNGVDRPTVEKADADFNTLGVMFRGDIDFGVKEQMVGRGYRPAQEGQEKDRGAVAPPYDYRLPATDSNVILKRF